MQSGLLQSTLLRLKRVIIFREWPYQVQEAIEQMVATVPKGTDLGLCDVISAMYSGYFVESGGAIMPAVDQYLNTFEMECF